MPTPLPDLGLDAMRKGDFPLAYGACHLGDAFASDAFPATPAPPRAVKTYLAGLRALDAAPQLNLATFVGTAAEEECLDLMMAALAVNEVDREEYQSTARIQDRCIRQLADLFHVPRAGEGGGEGEGGTSQPPTGFSTVGSSEALELALLALKHVWRAGRRAAGLDASRPNLVVPADVHVTMQKAAVYFDLELRSVPVPGPGVEPTPADLVAAADENSVGVVCVLGTTYTGHFQDAAGLDAALAAFNAAHRPPGSGTPPLRMHIDAASGGFVAPFAFPDVQADFRLANLASLNVSGHKFGQALAGIGWLLFRDAACLPPELRFEEKYLGNDQVTSSLNFSKSAAPLVGQAYCFLRLGRSGYTQVIGDCLAVAELLAEGLESTGAFDIVSARHPTPRVPMVAFTLKAGRRDAGYDEFDLADRLRERGWVLPAYPLAPGAEGTTILRAVCRSDFSAAMARALLSDVEDALATMNKHAAEERAATTSAVAAARATMAWKGGARSAAHAVTAAVTRAAAEEEDPEERARILQGLPTRLQHGGAC